MTKHFRGTAAQFEKEIIKEEQWLEEHLDTYHTSLIYALRQKIKEHKKELAELKKEEAKNGI